MKNLNPKSGLRQVSTGNIFVPRGLIIDLIKNKKIKPNELGYLILAIVSADWNDGEYRFGLIRHSTKKLSDIFSIPQSTLDDNLNKLVLKGVLTKTPKAFQVNNFEYFHRSKTYKNSNPNNEILNQLLGNSLLKSEKSDSNSEISDSYLSKTPSFLKVSSKVDISVNSKDIVNTRILTDYQRIYSEGGYSSLLPEDMRWLDRHITADGRTIL